MERHTGTNLQSQRHLENKQEEEQDGDDNISIASSDVYNNFGSLELPIAVKQSYSNISKVTGRSPFTKQKKLPEQDKDFDFMNKLKEKLNSKKDDGQLYGDLLATKLWRLSSSSKLHSKHEIDNIMFKYILHNEEDQQANVQATEINLQVLRQPHRHLFRQTVLYIINRINNRLIKNTQYRQDNFQICTVFKHNKKAM